MKNCYTRSFLLLFISVFFLKSHAQTLNREELPKAMREFRAAWIASVANINWPSKPGLTTDQQQKEAIDLLNLLEQHHFNAAILQIRPQADALYQSELEPWSYFLTGEQGKAPSPYYDPLEFWVKEAHQRGIELHVWLNPYRAHHLSGGEPASGSIVKSRPDLVLGLKDGQYWMDPSLKEVQDLSTAVVKDIVKRYDIDGVHFDDYFYPYDSYNGGADFPDDKSWEAYQKTGGKLSRGDWRRNSVNVFIQRVYETIKSEKKGVKFGLSPFGIWRPGYPESVQGYDQYEKLYADAKLWLNKGWIDYFTPQLYWKVNAYQQSFPVLLGWWQSENTLQRHLWPGMNVGLGGDDKNIDEVINQIMISRAMTPHSKGAVHWSIAPLVKYDKMRKGLVEGPYKNEALVPESPWLDKRQPRVPAVLTSPDGSLVKIGWKHTDATEVFRWVVYFRYGNKWNYRILNKNEFSLSVLKEVRAANGQKEMLNTVAVTAVSRTGVESEVVLVHMQP